MAAHALARSTRRLRLSHAVWRIAARTRDHPADDRPGAGARPTGGRWNAPGLPAVHAAETRALACLEALVQFNAGGLPLNRYLVAVESPDDLWRSSGAAAAGDLPIGWDGAPPGQASIQSGSDWLAGAAAAPPRAPSVVVPEEVNILLNPLQPQAARIRARKLRRWLYDPRMGRGGSGGSRAVKPVRHAPCVRPTPARLPVRSEGGPWWRRCGWRGT